ncbi:YHYH domain-containing protein [Nisaea sediminum]
MRRKTIQFILLTAALMFFSEVASAHSGGTDSSGCHHNRKTGGYHCH